MLRYSFALIRSFSNYLTLHRSDLTALAAPLGPALFIAYIARLLLYSHKINFFAASAGPAKLIFNDELPAGNNR